MYRIMQHGLLTTKKTLYYNFFPTKAEEDQEKASGGLIRRRPPTLIEIRDLYPPPPMDHWLIHKTISPQDAESETILLSYEDVFEHVLRYWTMDKARLLVESERKVEVVIQDVTEKECYVTYLGNANYLELAKDGSLNAVLVSRNLMRERKVSAGCVVSLRWNIYRERLLFKYRRPQECVDNVHGKKRKM